MSFKKRLLIISGIPLVIILMMAAALVFLGTDIIKQANRVKQLKENWDFKVSAIKNLTLLRQDSEVAEQHLAELENFLPTRDQLINFPNDLNVIGQQNKFDLNARLGQESPKTAKELGQIEFTMTGQGSFESFLNFLKSLENSRYSVKFKTLDLVRQDEKKLRASLTGSVFSF